MTDIRLTCQWIHPASTAFLALNIGMKHLISDQFAPCFLRGDSQERLRYFGNWWIMESCTHRRGDPVLRHQNGGGVMRVDH